MRVLLVEPHLGGSHRAWAERFAQHSSHDVAVIGHEGANWRWRLRGGSVTLAEDAAAWVADHGPPDVVLASSPLDVAAFAGLARTWLGRTPIVAYLHENQVVYPRADAADVDAAWRTWTSLVAADHVVVNSRHHLDQLSTGLAELLPQAPDHHHGHLLDEVLARIEVVPVGVDLPEPSAQAGGSTPRVIWNHRWDADKNPDVFVRAVERIRVDGHPIEVVLGGADHWAAGQRRRDAAERLGDAVVAAGPFDDTEYRTHLADADIVVSVADHDFFGVSVIEGIAAGCVPVLPRRLAYPELIPPPFHDAVFYDDGEFRRRLEAVVADLPAARRAVQGLAGSMAAYGWDQVAPQLDRVLGQVAAAT